MGTISLLLIHLADDVFGHDTLQKMVPINLKASVWIYGINKINAVCQIDRGMPGLHIIMRVSLSPPLIIP